MEKLMAKVYPRGSHVRNTSTQTGLKKSINAEIPNYEVTDNLEDPDKNPYEYHTKNKSNTASSSPQVKIRRSKSKNKVKQKKSHQLVKINKFGSQDFSQIDDKFKNRIQKKFNSRRTKTLMYNKFKRAEHNRSSAGKASQEKAAFSIVNSTITQNKSQLFERDSEETISRN